MHFPFASITRVLAGFQENEIIIELNVKKILKILVHYSEQRTLLIELLKLAYSSGLINSKKDKYNDPHNINFLSVTMESLSSLIMPSIPFE